MRPSTEDLLSVRDGEPLDAAAHAAVEAPAGAWERILAAEERARTTRRRAVGAFAGFGAAAAIAVAALIYFAAAPSADDPHIFVVNEWGAGPWRFAAAAQPTTYAELVAESARLERVL